jgi:uncharacterized membrane protein
MSKIAIEVVIDAPVDVVWADVEQIETHVDWMQDAESITFLTEHHRGVGTRFECKTVVGPFKLNDTMEITQWQHAKAMGVSHQGLVGGSGVFTLRASGASTVFAWVETLRFPWYFAGPVGATIARPILKAIWKGNLRRLKSRIEATYADQRRNQRDRE